MEHKKISGADRDLFSKAPSDAEFTAAELVVEGKLTLENIAERAGLPIEKVRRVMSNPQVRGYFAKHLDDAGATLEASARVIADAHNANGAQVVSYQGHAEVVDTGPDYMVRLKGAELNLKARGELRDGGTSVNLFMDLDDVSLARIASGELDPATLIDVGPRIDNPADKKE